MSFIRQVEAELAKIGVRGSDFSRVERALAPGMTTYEELRTGRKISREEAASMLGMSAFASGVSVSSLSGECVRSTPRGVDIYFRSSR